MTETYYLFSIRPAVDSPGDLHKDWWIPGAFRPLAILGASKDGLRIIRPFVLVLDSRDPRGIGPGDRVNGRGLGTDRIFDYPRTWDDPRNGSLRLLHRRADCDWHHNPPGAPSHTSPSLGASGSLRRHPSVVRVPRQVSPRAADLWRRVPGVGTDKRAPSENHGRSASRPPNAARNSDPYVRICKSWVKAVARAESGNVWQIEKAMD